MLVVVVGWHFLQQRLHNDRTAIRIRLVQNWPVSLEFNVSPRTPTTLARHCTYSHILLQYILIYHTALYCTILYYTALHCAAPHSDWIVSYRIVLVSYRRHIVSPSSLSLLHLSICLSHTHQFQLLPSYGSPHFRHRYSLGVLRHFLLIPMPSQLPHAQRNHLTQCSVHPITLRINFGGWMLKRLRVSLRTV